MYFNKEKIKICIAKGVIERDKRYIEQYIIEAIENFNYFNEIKNLMNVKICL